MEIRTTSVAPFAHLKKAGSHILVQKIGSPTSVLKKPGKKPTRHVSFGATPNRALSKPVPKPVVRSLNSFPRPTSTPLKAPKPIPRTIKPIQSPQPADVDVLLVPMKTTPKRVTHKRVKLSVNMLHFRKLPDSVLADISWFLIHQNRSHPYFNSDESRFIDLIMRKLLNYEIGATDASPSSALPDVS